MGHKENTQDIRKDNLNEEFGKNASNESYFTYTRILRIIASCNRVDNMYASYVVYWRC